MEPKPCASCHSPHFNDYDLCDYCTEYRQQELERRLRQDDGKSSWMVIAAMAIHGEQRRLERVWWVG